MSKQLIINGDTYPAILCDPRVDGRLDIRIPYSGYERLYSLAFDFDVISSISYGDCKIVDGVEMFVPDEYVRLEPPYELIRIARLDYPDTDSVIEARFTKLNEVS